MLGLEHRRARAAARWLARMRNEDTPFDRAGFERWRGRSIANAEAFDEAARSWGVDLPIAHTRFHQDSPPEPSVRGRDAGGPMIGAIAAALIAALLGLILLHPRLSERARPMPAEHLAARLSTSAAETRRFRLSDGSVATLGPTSLLSATYTGAVRGLTLLRGHARFEVAHDPARLFEVHAGESLITARGTIFDVRLDERMVHVALLRGVIDVERLDRGARTGKVTRLAAGQGLSLPSSGTVGQRAPHASDGGGAQQMLTFDKAPLWDAIEVLNARNARQIVLADPAARARQITGGFRADDLTGFAATVSTMFGLTVTTQQNGDLLLAPRR